MRKQKNMRYIEVGRHQNGKYYMNHYLYLGESQFLSAHFQGLSSHELSVRVDSAFFSEGIITKWYDEQSQRVYEESKAYNRFYVLRSDTKQVYGPFDSHASRYDTFSDVVKNTPIGVEIILADNDQQLSDVMQSLSE